MLTRLLAFVALASSFIPASFAQQGVAQGQGTAQGAGQIYVGPPTPPATVTIAPASQVLAVSTTQNFVATVVNDSFNQGVNWTLSGPGCSGATCGTLSATTSKSTVPITYTAPASAPSPNTVVLTATSILNPGGFANASITITSAPPPVVVGNICGTLQFQTPAGTNTFTCPPSNSSFIAFTIDVSTTDTPTGVQACLPLPPGAPGRCFNLIQACDPTNVCQGLTTPGGITQIWYGIGLPVGITTLIVTNSPAAGGVLDVSAIDAQNIVAFGGAAFSSGNNTATTNPVGPAITAIANSLTISTISSTGTATAVAAPFTFVPLSGGDGVAYQLNSTAGISTPNWTTTSGTWSGFTATFIGGTTKPVISVAMNPTAASVLVNTTLAVTPTVTNDTAGVNLALTGANCSGATCGTLSSSTTASGVSVTYTAPAAVPSPSAVVTLTASSITDPTKTATTAITVTSNPIVVTVSPGSATVQTSATQTFSCTVTNDAATAGCDWTLTGAGCSGATCGGISVSHTASGVTLTYTGPAAVPSPATVSLTATSTTDATKSAVATITVIAAPAIVVSVSPGSANVQTSNTKTFSCTVVNDAGAAGCDWALTGAGCSGATCGTLSTSHTASGVTLTYTAPGSVPSPATVTLTATSTTDGTKSAAATITVVAAPVLTVVVAPGSASVQTGHTQSFTPTVTNDGSNLGVDWTLSGFSNVGPTIPVTFFGMNNDARTGAGAYPTFPIGGIRLWDPAVTGWAGSQTGPSTYNFTNLNARLSDAPSGYDIMWTAGCSPNFIASSPGSTTPCQGNTNASASLPSDVATTDATWKGFITALVNNSLAQTHHIKFYEMNNEADLTQYCFNGAGLGNTDCTTNAANLVTMVHDAYTIIHALDPSALVVSPTGSTTCTNNCGVHLLPAFFAAGGAPYIDIVGMHSYMFNVPTGGQFSNVPEQITNIISQLRTLMSTYSISSLPLWFTEGSWGGGTNNANMTDAQKVAYIGREYLLMRMGGIARNYWYAYGNSQWGTLSDGAGNLTAAGTAMSLLDSWLVGATDLPGNCTQDGSLTWQCNINRQGSPAIIIWNPTNTPAVAVSSTYTSYLTLDNTTVNPIVSHSITAGPKPVMVIANLGTLSALHTASGTPVTYTAASVVPSPATVTITATSTTDATKAASSTITVFSLPIVVSVAPGTATVPVNGTQAFTPTVTNDAANAGVDWTLGSCTTFTENFNEGTLPAIWAATNATGVEGGGSFSPSHVSLSQGVLQMNVTQDGTTAGSVGAEIELNRQFGYGTYSWSMQAAGTSATQGGSGSAVSGQISSTFQYSGGNPVPTEIDSPEIEGQFPNQIEWTTWLNGVKSDFHQTTLTNPQNTYHIYKYIWAPGSIAFYLDGSLIWTSTTNVPTGPAFPIANLWGTNSTSFGGLATAGVTRYMYINNFTYSNCGTLSATHTASGTPVTYTAPPNTPSPATVTITATSTTDNTKSATSTITIGTAPNITIAVAPATASVTTNGVQNFTATLTNDTSNQGATWALSGAGCSGATCGTLSKSGSASGVPITYTAPSSAPSPATVTLTATSVTDPTKTATATITVTSPVVTVTVSPKTATFQAGTGTQVFTASVANSGATPAWTLSCSVSNCGSITPTSGTTTTYTPPASVASTITVTLTATVTGPVTGTATITVNPTTGPFSCVGAPCPAFAGAGSTAMGSGALSLGGRGGVVYNVNTISDATNAGCVPNGTATCSLRDCVQATGARTCIFTVSGNISLTGRMTVSNPFLTVAGQTSPGGGIWTTNPTCTDCLWWIQTHDVVIRYIGCSGENPSIPSGPNTGTGCFLFTNANNYNDIIDHTSFRWWGNKGLIFGSNGGGSTHEVTLQWSLIYEPNIGHPVCVMFDDTDSEVLGNVNEDSHHNMLVNCDHRMPLFNNKSGRWANNLVYDYGTSNYAFLSQGGTTTDIINNMYVGGNLGGNSFEPFMFNNAQSTDSSGGMPGPPSTFISGNVFRSDPTQTTGVASNQQSLTATGTEGGQTGAPAPSAWFRSTQLATPQFPIVPDNAINLPNVMLATVGDSQNLDCLGNFQINRNSQDQRIINQYQTNGNGAYFNNQYSSPALLPGTPCTESLHDGIPDAWKTRYGLSTTNATLYKTIDTGTGLTYLEDYLDGLTPAGGGSPPVNTHYISKSIGSDANSGTSKTAPWAHLPGMPSCASNCASYTPVAGDQFILMGCDVWVPSDFKVNWDWSGSRGNPIYIGVDKTWFNTTSCPSTWNRPVFDGQNTTTNEFVTASADNATAWVTLDNIEMKRAGSCLNFDAFNATTNWKLSNLYVHAWHQVTDTNGPVFQFQSGNTFITGVIDGSDSTPTPGVTCNYFYSTPPDVINSVLHDMPNAIVGYAGGGSGVTTATWSGNDIYNINASNGGSHGNAIETVGGGTYYIHDNRIHHMGGCPGCEAMFIGNSGETDYVWNNVIYDLGASGNSAQTPSIGGESGGNTNFWNDTIVASDAQSCINNGGQGAVNDDIHVRNVHCIQGSSGGSVSDFTDVISSLLQTTTQADANSSPHFDQYTASETFPYSPLASTNSTVGAGTNLTSNCTGSNAGLCSDISYYVQQTINGVVQAVPARTANARPSSGAWDIGAYEF